MDELFGDHYPYKQRAEPKQHNSKNAKTYFMTLDDVVNNPQQGDPNGLYIVNLSYFPSAPAPPLRTSITPEHKTKVKEMNAFSRPVIETNNKTTSYLLM
jgi:hypothetical protein